MVNILGRMKIQNRPSDFFATNEVRMDEELRILLVGLDMSICCISVVFGLTVFKGLGAAAMGGGALATCSTPFCR